MQDFSAQVLYSRGGRVRFMYCIQKFAFLRPVDLTKLNHQVDASQSRKGSMRTVHIVEMSYPLLASALRQVASKSSSPNALLYDLQREVARRNQFPDGSQKIVGGDDHVVSLGDGSENAESKSSGSGEHEAKTGQVAGTGLAGDVGVDTKQVGEKPEDQA
ncbi:hypothetical protein LTR10_006177 [Elasticomyces elasticus]|nr:hypothetical protein LTR10_006177 [Elasticomyces elasticus]KAK4966773.1 hypothetical protein LTR42_011084 [Elasticomyces elasticus]